ncbi:MAG: hypothetical protein HBSAPP02_17690 [Phycisphaerae bacterium]|nr:MAG: hypothetical protein HRU71_02520 [Planctomycetia bacterium]RIK70058.1 MAG: hypothetical protein DCC66_06730 [Planctomycetota bacterium]GJQ26737.1 MAG: hypothetical protein HBSAPP02_17690 [Phycisphaerae bacterium]
MTSTHDSIQPVVVTNETKSASRGSRFWSRVLTMAGLAVLGLTPWANAALPQPDLPAICPPLTAFAHPTFFDFLWGTTPIKFPY